MMRALVIDNGLHLKRIYPTPTPPKGEALVRVWQAGICNTDLELVKGYMNFTGVPGHEFVGVVEQALADKTTSPAASASPSPDAPAQAFRDIIRVRPSPSGRLS